MFPSELLGYLSRLQEILLGSSEFFIQDESVMENVVTAISNTVMSAVRVLHSFVIVYIASTVFG